MPARLAQHQAAWGGDWVTQRREMAELSVSNCGTKQLMADDGGALHVRRVLCRLDKEQVMLRSGGGGAE